MNVLPVGCAVCKDCPVEVPHYCPEPDNARARAHAKWLSFNERVRVGMGLAVRELEAEAYVSPPSGIVDLCMWGEWHYRSESGLAAHSVDLAALARAERVIANLPPAYAETLWAAYVERGDAAREDARPAPHGRPQRRDLPRSLALAERSFMVAAKRYADTTIGDRPRGAAGK